MSHPVATEPVSPSNDTLPVDLQAVVDRQDPQEMGRAIIELHKLNKRAAHHAERCAGQYYEERAKCIKCEAECEESAVAMAHAEHEAAQRDATISNLKERLQSVGKSAADMEML